MAGLPRYCISRDILNPLVDPFSELHNVVRRFACRSALAAAALRPPALTRAALTPAALLAIGLGLVVLVADAAAEKNRDRRQPRPGPRRTRRRRSTESIAPASNRCRCGARAGAPQPGDWLASQKENGQTFAEYRRVHPQRQPGRRTLYLQPIGPFSESSERLVEATSALLGVFYDAQVKRLPVVAGLTIPAEARRKNPHTGKEQILSTYVLDKLLIPARPRTPLRCWRITATDLWPGEGWNFVFGQASLTERVGVWSIARYGDPAGRRRGLSDLPAAHAQSGRAQTGHMLGIQHCTAFACGMNGSNGAEEMDRNPLAFCPECSAKILVGLPDRPKDWFTTLEQFADRWDLADEAAFWKRSRTALED